MEKTYDVLVTGAGAAGLAAAVEAARAGAYVFSAGSAGRATNGAITAGRAWRAAASRGQTSAGSQGVSVMSVPFGKLPGIVAPGDEIGRISTEAAAATAVWPTTQATIGNVHN